MITESKRTVGTWSMLFQRALPLCNDVEEAVLCADIALSSLSKEDIITLYENKTPQENKERISQEELSTFFAYDVHNRKAQGILNRSLQSVKGLTVSAKKDLESILKRKSKDPSKAILEFIDKYRVQLAKLLTTTQLASVLEGAREVAKGIPTLAVFAGATNLPPSLEPKDAVALVDRLKKLSVEDRAKAIYDLPSDQQTYAQHAVAAAEAGGMEPPPLVRVSSYESDDIHLPTIEEAVKSLSERNVVTRQQFDELDAAARTKAFTVANVSAEETLTKIRDSLSENVKEGVDYETWRKKVMEDVDQGTFLSEAHQETVFRTNVQSAFSDGQMTVLRHPLVRSGFPYSAYDSIHDGRRRENHGKLEKLGIQGTNVYRNDDPVFQTFRPPWDYNDRCGWTPMTIRQAAEKGIEEAKKWLDTGVEPTDKAHVPMPDFAPPPEFQRALASAPLSIRLSLQSIEVFNSPAPHDDRGQALSVTEDTYPRNASNQFLDKFLVAEAARSKAKHEELRESLPEDQRWKLDRCVGWLQSGGTIHHPKERPGLAINISGLVDSKDWLEYSFKADAYDKWLERDQVRRDWKADVEKFTKTLRHSEPAAVAYRGLAAIGVDDTITETREAVDEVLGKYNSYLDELDSQFESIGATDQEARTTARLRRSVNLDITNAVEKYIHLRKTSDDKSLVSSSLNSLLDMFQSTTTKINSSYEDIVECVCKRIEDDISADEEPEEPQEPNEEGEQRSDPIMLAIGGQPRNAPSEIIYRFAHFRSKYSDTVILNVRTGIQNKLGHVPNVQLPQGTQLTVVGEDREQDGTRSIIAAVTKWGGNVSMSIGDKAQSPEEEKEERSTIIAGILVALFGDGAVDVAKELFKKSPDGDVSAAFASSPNVTTRYGKKPGPGWVQDGLTVHGLQRWKWGPAPPNYSAIAQQGPQQVSSPLQPQGTSNATNTAANTTNANNGVGGDSSSSGNQSSVGLNPTAEGSGNEDTAGFSEAAEKLSAVGLKPLVKPVDYYSKEYENFWVAMVKAAYDAGLVVPESKFYHITGDTSKFETGDVNHKNIGAHEHNVYIDSEKNRVLKMTAGDAGGTFGLNQDAHSYLKRIETINKMWPSLGYKFEGFIDNHDKNPRYRHVSIVTSMNFISGEHPSTEEVHEWFKGLGFEPIEPPWVAKKREELWQSPDEAENIKFDPMFRDPSSGMLIDDVRGDNFIKTASGLVPIDVNIIEPVNSKPLSINAAFANGPPQVQRRYGRRPGPGWTAHGVTGRGVQIWIWGQNNQAGAAQQPPAPQQPAAPAAPAPSPTPQTPPPVAVPTPTPPTPPPAQPQAAQLRAGGQRARFQSIQAYNAAMAKLSAGQQLTQADKLSLATKLTNMPTPMLRSLHGALVQPGMPGPHFTRPGHINAIKNIINPPPQTPAPPVVGPGPGVGGAPGPMPSGLQVRPPAPTPAQMPSGLQVKPPAAPQVPQGPPQPTTPAVPKSTQKQVWTTGQAQPGTSLNGIPFAPAPPKFWEKTPDVDVKEPPPLKTVNRVGVLIQEPDGRMWIVQPTNGFGNRNHTLPGGTVEKGLTNQQNALKEVWEETGLQVEITGHAGDFEDSNNGNNGRLYIGKRVGGAPWDAKIESFIIDQKTGKPAAESETVTLVSPEEAGKLLHRTDDLAQLMVVHPMSVKTPTTGAGSNPLKKLIAALEPKAKAYRSTGKQGDSQLHAIQEMRGFNKKPSVINKKDFDALIAQGGHVEMLRGINGVGWGTTRKTGAQLADQFRDGDHFPGYGCFGNGTYADSNKHSGSKGARAGGNYSTGSEAFVRIALPKTAKIIKQSELEKLVPKPPPGFSGGSVHGATNEWLGLHAALAGYDAIEVDGKSARHGSYGDGFYCILNRGVLIVQKEDAKGHRL